MTNDSQPTPGQPARLQIRVGSWVRQDETLYQITDISDFESVIAVAIETGRKRQLKIEELESVPPPAGKVERKPVPLDAFTDEESEIAQQRLEMIRPLVDMRCPSRADFEKRAGDVGFHYTTLYRWYGRYAAWENVTALAPGRRGWTKGKYRIKKEAEDITQKVIGTYYLPPKRRSKDEPMERPSIEDTINEIKILCDEAKIPPPSNSTIRQRISRIPEWKVMQHRDERKRGKEKFWPVPGHFPDADFPLSVVQIDHKDVDLILVDDEDRKSIGRVWLTLAIDVYSRMVTGYHLSLDSPSTTSVAMCLSHSFLPKDSWLSDRDIEGEWPVWGFPGKILADNAREFHAKVLQKACQKYDVNLEFRPVRKPEYGGHIERLLGTLGKKIHDLPGATFSSIKERGEYDSEKNAALTLTELEKVLLELICNVYHRSEHSEIEMSPLKKWEMGIRGNPETKVQGIGLPDKPGNPKELEIDFLPMFERTIQRTGVSKDLVYYGPILNRWIGARDPKNPTKGRKFVFHRDPRNITTIWFWEPSVGQYFPIPATHRSLPPMSIWEYKEAKTLAKNAGRDPDSPAVILGAIKRIREIKNEAKAKTKTARRDFQRRKEHEKNQSPAAVNAPVDIAEAIPSDEFTEEPLEGFPVYRYSDEDI